MGANELQAKVEVAENELKGKLIDEIIFQCKVSNVSDNKNIPLDSVFMNLIGLSVSELKNIISNL